MFNISNHRERERETDTDTDTDTQTHPHTDRHRHRHTHSITESKGKQTMSEGEGHPTSAVLFVAFALLLGVLCRSGAKAINGTIPYTVRHLGMFVTVWGKRGWWFTFFFLGCAAVYFPHGSVAVSTSPLLLTAQVLLLICGVLWGVLDEHTSSELGQCLCRCAGVLVHARARSPPHLSSSLTLMSLFA